MKETVIYNRVSSEDQHPELQLVDCEKLVKELNLSSFEVLSEKKSAWKDNIKREVFDNIRKGIQEGKVKNLIVWDFDRLYRNRLKTVDFIRNYSKIGLKVYSVRQDWFQALEKIPVPFNDMMKDLMLQVVGWIAEEESNKKSERTKLAVKRDEKGVTVSYKGNKWGRKSISKATKEEVLKLKGLSVREISKRVTYWDKNKHKKNISIGAVHKILAEKHPLDSSQKLSSKGGR